MNVLSSNVGYPRIGENREWKAFLESYWRGELDQETFLSKMDELHLQHVKKQKDAGIDLVPIGDFTFYDHVLDTAFMFGLVPKRFHSSHEQQTLDTYFQMARGSKDAVACEMTKWFNTNYHYIVPELNDVIPTLVENRPLRLYKQVQNHLQIDGKPVLLGPISFVKLSKGYEYRDFKSIVKQFVPLYAQILSELEEAGVQWVQLDEPVLVTDITEDEIALFHDVYEEFHQSAPNLNLLLQTYFERVEHYQSVVSLPVQAIGLDFVNDQGENLKAIQKYGFPPEKILAAGVIDGRNIWRMDLEQTVNLLDELTSHISNENLIVQPSCSLLHVPVTVKSETSMNDSLKEALSFADEKLQELVLLTKGIQFGKEAIKKEISKNKKILKLFNESSARQNTNVIQEMAYIESISVERKAPFRERQNVQQQTFQLPLFPTTTIGSFPQTSDVRLQRAKWRKGEISQEDYSQFIKNKINDWIKIQEEIGLDVFVHGEFERTDMVEFFGEKLGGFEVTKAGWVQSYGSRCVKPPIIYGDVYFQTPMTVKETTYAQSLTNKPVKGMLTGPITILNWSFVRHDLPRHSVANQIALALQKEVKTLEQNGIRMIQVDEPALREGLPLKKEDWESYLNAAVYAFKIATTSVENDTQIHTHMCYSNFEDIIEAIQNLDADVISIESSRSHGELITSFEQCTYENEIGLGVYDIHSPRVPKINEMTQSIERAVHVLPKELIWVNPDCGLKTRGIEETIEALKVMVKAAKKMRSRFVVHNEQ